MFRFRLWIFFNLFLVLKDHHLFFNVLDLGDCLIYFKFDKILSNFSLITLLSRFDAVCITGFNDFLLFMVRNHFISGQIELFFLLHVLPCSLDLSMNRRVRFKGIAVHLHC